MAERFESEVLATQTRRDSNAHFVRKAISGRRIKKGFTRHVDHHMEEISLESLPRGDDMTDGGNNSIPNSATHG